ncbi:MFS transporter [Sphingomonas gilva]|uniref:MFS transporter n=1 Tax=Sphingomonas gilva TaxID=2305907 RepID=A0A396RKB7_9SPHN|nr:MFS transporter [Sphingomonas gilva]RHW16697.1 MFS transporter [Sphingomonas gilva]
MTESGALESPATLAAEADLARREAEYGAFVEDNLRRNYIAHFAHGMLGMTGFRLIFAPTFVPAYLFSITGSATMVGLGQALQQLGSVLSPIIGATQVEHRQRVMPVAVRIGLGMRLPLLLLALSGWLMTGAPLLLVTMVLLFAFGFFSGSQRVVFQMMLAKVIPIAKRGRLQAWRNFAGGGLAALISYFAGTWFIEHDVLGNGYAAVFLLAFILTAIGLFVLQRLMIEPLPPTVRPRMGMRERLRELPGLFTDRDYRHFVLAQALAIAGRMSLPFCILYAGRSNELSGAYIGLLSLAFLGADTLSNLVWGPIGDRKGFRLTFMLALVVWIAALVLLIESDSVAMTFLVFAGLGASQSGYMMSASTLVLEFGARDDIPMRLALSTTTETAIASLGPLAGGVIAASFGYIPLFWVSIAFLVAALATLILIVREPRTRAA